MSFNLDPVEQRIVDNRLFLIGLDDLYRSSMRELESTHLLECARTVARTLGATPAAVPVEGYYTESIALTEYFQLMRALQEVDEDQAWKVRGLPEFSLMHAIATSGCFGRPRAGQLLPRCWDALALALEETAPDDWSTRVLVARARAKAIETGDFSLVALAARTGDAVAVAATRESVVLYAMDLLGDSIGSTEYLWQVDNELSLAANLFIHAFNQFGGRPLPPAVASSAEAYYEASTNADLAGRCVAIAFDPGSGRHYHWAIAGTSLDDFQVEEFWDPDLWTTSRYKSKQIIKGGW